MGFSILCHYFNKKLSSCFPYPFLLFQSETNFPFIFLFSCFILMTVKKPVCQCTTELLLAHELNQFTLNLFRRILIQTKESLFQLVSVPMNWFTVFDACGISEDSRFPV